MNFFKKIISKLKDNKNEETENKNKSLEPKNKDIETNVETQNKKPVSHLKSKVNRENYDKKKLKVAQKVCLGLGLGFFGIWIILYVAIKRFVSDNKVIDIIGNLIMFVVFGLFIAFSILKRKERKDKND